MTWTRRVSVLAVLALVFAAIWTVVDDDLFYASLVLAALGLVLLPRVLRESRRAAALLGALLALPILQFPVLLLTIE